MFAHWSWPIGSGKEFKGVYNIYSNELVLYKPHQKQDTHDTKKITDLNDPLLVELIGEDATIKLKEDMELIGVYPEFDVNDYLGGEITPVFFGSALNNFGVKELLDCFIDIAPTPKRRETTAGDVDPDASTFSGFIFKIHANIDPKHRDRIAFLRICSGTFERQKNIFMFVVRNHFEVSTLLHLWHNQKQSLMKPTLVILLGCMIQEI